MVSSKVRSSYAQQIFLLLIPNICYIYIYFCNLYKDFFYLYTRYGSTKELSWSISVIIIWEPQTFISMKRYPIKICSKHEIYAFTITHINWIPDTHTHQLAIEKQTYNYSPSNTFTQMLIQLSKMLQFHFLVPIQHIFIQ